MSEDVTTILFACIHNAGRSQMAAAFFNALADPAKARAISAGTEPAGEVHPEVVDAMREVGIDLTDQTPTKLSWDTAREADVIVSMGCGDACPVFPGKRYEDWDLDDPAGLDVHAVRSIRDDIRLRVQRLISELATTPG